MMVIFGLIALAALQVTQGCVDNDHQPGCQIPAPPPCPCPCPGGPYNCDLQCPCEQQCPAPFPCGQWPAGACISSLTRVANLQYGCPGPVLQSAVQCPLYPEPLVPVVENHVGHHVVKTVKRVPVVHKYCRPELVIRTRHVPIVKHRKRVFIEPYPSVIPITDKLIRQVIHEITHKIPVVEKNIRPYTYQTIRHVPQSCARCVPTESAPAACQICGPQNCQNCPTEVTEPNFPVGCNAPCSGICAGSHSPTTCSSFSWLQPHHQESPSI